MRRPGIALRRVALAASLCVAFLGSPARSAPGGPIVHHTPPPFATQYSSIAVVAQAVCAQKPMHLACTATIFYRTTQPGSPAELLGSGDPAWASLTMSRDAGLNASGETVFTFSVSLPSSIADTRGVDYVIKVNDGGLVSYSPGRGTFRTGAHHVYVTNPVSVHHAPVTQSLYRQPITIRADATCASRCSARLFYRRTGSADLTDLDDPATGLGPIDWRALDMQITGVPQSSILEQYGAGPYTFGATIPASFVDTRGVDYAIRVTDGPTRSYWPGTVYNGYVAPSNGSRLAWQHVHVVNPVLAWHPQTVYAASRNTPVTVSLHSLCWVPLPENCSVELSYAPFGIAPVTKVTMPKSGEIVSGAARLITYSYTIPAAAVQYPSLHYWFRITDGYTTMFSPGSAYNGYYAPLQGQQTGWHVVAVSYV